MTCLRHYTNLYKINNLKKPKFLIIKKRSESRSADMEVTVIAPSTPSGGDPRYKRLMTSLLKSFHILLLTHLIQQYFRGKVYIDFWVFYKRESEQFAEIFCHICNLVYWNALVNDFFDGGQFSWDVTLPNIAKRHKSDTLERLTQFTSL